MPAIHRAFDYILPQSLGAVGVGTVVRVPLHGRRVRGWVLDADVEAPEAPPDRLLEVVQVVSAGPPAEVIELCRWAAWRWAGPLATFLRAASAPNRVLAVAAPEIDAAVYPELLAPGHPWRRDAVVVVSPTGSLDALPLLAPEGSTIVVDPIPARAARLAAGWRDEGREVVTLGGDHPAAHRTRAWDRARAGACVAVGGRTAVLAPVPDLNRIIVLDEADEALEEERAPTWNARDVAIERSRRVGATVRLVTPAPTIDALVALGAPAADASGPRWPRTEVVDQRDEDPSHGLLSGALADALHRTIARGDRAVCVLNRTGRARLLACVTCRELARCERCGATVQQRDAGFVCAQCATERPVVCLHCHASRFRALRPGVKRVREDLAALLPRTDVVAVDATSMEVPDAPVLIGTEAVLHRVPGRGSGGEAAGVGLVAYLEIDQELLAPRARAAEQALWLLVRGARALRADGRGQLLVQTRIPDHEVIRAVVDSSPLIVAEGERGRRQLLGFPPFGGLAELQGRAVSVEAACAALSRDPAVVVLGPVEQRPRAGASQAGAADTASRALVKAASVAQLCDALAAPAVDAARELGRLRVDVDPRHV